MGIRPADLLAASCPRTDVPTFTEYIPRVRGAVSDGTPRVYGSYWNRILERWPDRRLDDITGSASRPLTTGARTESIAELVAAGEPRDRVAEVYDIAVNDVDAAVRYDNDRAA
jgi:integrase/recombinase XerC